MSKDKVKTAAELWEELEHDPEYQRRKAEEDARLELLSQQYRREQKLLILDLANVGILVESVWDLVNSREGYAKAIPVLLAHLDKSYSERTTEGIIRALTIKHARGKAGKKLLKMFRGEKNKDLRWVIGNALSVVAAPDDTEEVVDLLRDVRFGESRSELTHAVGRLKGADAIPLLISLLEDEDIAADAVIALGKLKAVEARPHIEKLLSHPDSWVRQQARNALKNIDKTRQ